MLRIPERLLRKTEKRFNESDDGSIAIEFGMIAPFFFLMIFVFIETAGMMFQEYALQAGVHEAGRLVRTGQAQNNGMNIGGFVARICGVAKVIPDCQSKVRVYVNAKTTFTQMAADVPAFGAVGADKDGVDKNVTFACGAPQQVVAVIVTYDHQYVLPFMKFFSNTQSANYRRLTATSMFRNEPFAAAATCAAS